MNKRTVKESLLVYGPGILIAILGFLFAWKYVDPAPPYKIVLATGSTSGDYYKVGKALGQQLSHSELQVEVVESAGSSENLKLLRDGKVDIAFVQGGITPDDKKGLKALGSLYLEPLWLLRRTDSAEIERLSEMKGQRIGVGSSGSGTRALALSLLKQCEVSDQNELVELGSQDSVVKLLAGELDAVFLVGPPHSELLLRALRDPGVELVDFRRAPAFSRLHPILKEVLIPEGSLDMALNLPAGPKRMVAPAATLVVREDFHPALVGVVLSAAHEVVGDPDVLSDRDQFPSPDYCSFELRQEARMFYKRGASFLYRHLPFRFAATVDRMVIMLLPFLTLLIPLAKVLPALFDWRMRSKIHKHYKSLLRLETRLQTAPKEELLLEMDEMEEKVAALLTMPASYGADVHHLQVHLRTVRTKLEERPEEPVVPPNEDS